VKPAAPGYVKARWGDGIDDQAFSRRQSALVSTAANSYPRGEAGCIPKAEVLGGPLHWAFTIHVYHANRSGDAQGLKNADLNPAWIELVPCQSMPSRSRVRVMIIVPTFSERDEGNPPVVTGIVPCQEPARARLIVRLQRALDEVNVLKGLLSICASCKRIRDEHDSWQPLESYIQAHSGAKFTHGLCPECLRKLYPTITANDKRSRSD